MRQLALLPLFLLGTAASAADGETQIGVYGGAIFMDQLETLGSSWYVTPRVTWWYNDTLAFEGEVGVIQGRTRIGDHPYFGLIPKVGIVGNLAPDQAIQPLLVAGTGVFFKSTSCTDRTGADAPCSDGDVLGGDYVTPDADYVINAGPALQVRLGETPLALRTDYRFLVNLGTENFRNRGDAFIDWEWTLGLSYAFGGAPDTDKDGLADELDQCVDEPEDMDGFEDEDGCPDTDNDGDGILDASDACPIEAEDLDGWDDNDGCADLDNDGDTVQDKFDVCPDEEGSPDAKGCPDQDGDTLADMDDDCPEAAGSVEMVGCPDTDGDTVADIDDTCPEEAGDPKAEGCTDSDGDLVPDVRDECPEEPAAEGVDPRRSNGCPSVVYFTDKQLVITETIRFSSGKATIQSSSNKLLDQIAETFLKYTGVKKVEVQGHTDDQGDDEANLTLSQDRAAAVVAYLVEKGVEADRLVAKGYGETKPLVENDSSKNRAKNRRVQFEILEQEQLWNKRLQLRKKRKGAMKPKAGAAKPAGEEAETEAPAGDDAQEVSRGADEAQEVSREGASDEEAAPEGDDAQEVSREGASDEEAAPEGDDTQEVSREAAPEAEETQEVSREAEAPAAEEKTEEAEAEKSE